MKNKLSDICNKDYKDMSMDEFYKMNKIIIKLLGITAQVILYFSIAIVFYAVTTYPLYSNDTIKDLFDILGRITLVMSYLILTVYLVVEINKKIK